MRDLKQRINSGSAVIGTWITLGHPAIAEIMAASGFEFITVDLEHSTISMAQAGELIRTIDLAGSAPLVRLSSNDPVQIKRVMDAGAHGIIVPMVNSADDARTALSAMLYPPDGIRGVGLARAQGYGASFQAYKQSLREDAVFIAQIEHIQGVENLREILAVDGLDGIIVGPYDLSASLGLAGEFEAEEVQRSLRTIEELTLESGKALGIHVVEPDEKAMTQRLAQGYRFLAYSLDIRMLDVSCRQGIATFNSRNNT
jgi:2-dehydro-3-deoxyglucarate aldolase